MKKTVTFTVLLTMLLALSAVAADSFAADTEGKFVAYYFYTTQRCATCRKIETLSGEAIRTSFTDELKKGTLVFQAVNIDELQYRHFVQDFKLYTKSLVIAKMAGDKAERYNNLTKVWQLVYSPDDFSRYVKTEISTFMAGK